jgi:AraC-like DNA-binding protein
MKKFLDNNFFVYFDPPPAGSSLYVTTVGKVTTLPHADYPYKKNKHPEKYILEWEKGRILDEFQFIYISEGGGQLRSFEGETPLRQGSLISLVPGEKHRYTPDPETGWTEYWIGFSGTSPREWLDQGQLEKVITLHPILNQREMLVPFNEALEFARDQNAAIQPLAASCVMRIFAYLVERRHMRFGGEDFDLIDQAKKIFEKNIYFPIDMDEVTDILHINYQQLRDRFRGKTGLSPYQYFLQLKINKAKELLLEGTLSIKEISYKLAFESPYYFSRLFKRKTGVAPSQWCNTSSPKDLDFWVS